MENYSRQSLAPAKGREGKNAGNSRELQAVSRGSNRQSAKACEKLWVCHPPPSSRSFCLLGAHSGYTSRNQEAQTPLPTRPGPPRSPSPWVATPHPAVTEPYRTQSNVILDPAKGSQGSPPEFPT
ncbi:hypothetical protein P7K49_002411 [Saguinus oedipus]|uniref:Uncharacterized protein n=1 Tax=Saguinus oedipus TaxID=9490 RepID=A0ABQ9WH89_SAGOE|nr:hypothetical protein P7K49_002411 [Saguinus oedipus]